MFRDLDPLGAAEFGGLSGRVGDVSREGLGEVVAEGGAEKRGVGIGVVEARFKGRGEDSCESPLAVIFPSTLLARSLNSGSSFSDPVKFSPEVGDMW